jgi:hypothetical protein
VPLLVVEAHRDRIADNPRNRSRLAESLGGRWSLATFDAEHFLLGERCRDDVLDLIMRWTATVSTPVPQGELTW